MLTVPVKLLLPAQDNRAIRPLVFLHVHVHVVSPLTESNPEPISCVHAFAVPLVRQLPLNNFLVPEQLRLRD